VAAGRTDVGAGTRAEKSRGGLSPGVGLVELAGTYAADSGGTYIENEPGQHSRIDVGSIRVA
jgi:hypothetical protein